MVESEAEKYFPAESFRDKQHYVVDQAIKALFYDDYDNLVLDGPVGTGKSLINTALLRKAGGGFYTTPQKSLREQLDSDELLNDHLVSLKARRDYHCSITGDNCEECAINQSDERSCSEKGPKCTYWANKMRAINSPIAALTFSYMIIDGMIPQYSDNGDPISFGNRKMLVVDEAQNLIQQTAHLHAGFKISPYSLPDDVFNDVTSSVPYSATVYDDVEKEVKSIYSNCNRYIDDDLDYQDMSPKMQKCSNLKGKIEWMWEQIDQDNAWVVEVESVPYKGSYVKSLEFSPVYVGSFLKNYMWNRAEKRVISTATLPYRSKPEIWLQKVGLDPENTKLISVSMPFEAKNRPIHTSTTVCSMSGGGDQDHWDEIMEQLQSTANVQSGKKGLIHTSSYSRANRIAESADEYQHPDLHNNLFVHDRERNTEVQIEEWQSSNLDIMLSPSMCEGVDLPGEMCEWQVLLKVPYPSMSSRLQYIIDNEKYGWLEYQEEALVRLVQSYGRAIRSKEDYADYYVFDEDFHDLLNRRTAPSWFTESIDIVPPREESVFDY